MRRKRIVHIYTSENFYRILEEGRKKASSKIGKEISFPNFTEIAFRSGLNFNNILKGEKKRR